MDPVLSEIKSILKSLIVSSPRGMTIDQLNRDYRKMEGQNIPYAKLGFSSLEKFLKSMPDTLTVHGTGSEALLFAICSDKLKHINAMICNQKSVSKQRKNTVAILGTKSDKSQSTATSSSSLSMPTKSTAVTTTTISETSVAPTTISKTSSTKLSATSAPFVYSKGSSLKSNLSLTTSVPSNYSNSKSSFGRSYANAKPNYHLQNFDNQPYHNYYAHQQYYLNSNQFWMNPYNYNTQQQYRYTNPMSFVQANISQYFNNINSYGDSIQPITSGNTSVSETLQNIMCPQENQSLSNLQIQKTKEDNKSKNENPIQITTLQTELQSLQTKLQRVEENEPSNMVAINNSSWENHKNETNQFVNNSDSSLLTNSINDESLSLGLSDVDTKKQNRSLKLFSNLKISNVNDNNYEKSNSQNEERIKPVESSNFSCSATNDSFSRLSSTRKTIETDNSSRSLSSKSMNKIQINIKTTTDQLKNMSSEKNTSTRLQSAFNNNEQFDSGNRNTAVVQVKNTPSDAIPEQIPTDIIKLLDFPSDVATYNDKIPQSEIPSEIENCSFFRLFVSEIHNPYKFWFHCLRSTENELDNLMQDIENVYNDLCEKELKMNLSNIKPGQICAALYSKLWHRGEILENPINNKVKVLFIDYGTVSYVETKSIKYLLKDFCKLPRQALRGSLSHIKPNGHRWTRDATISFLDMTSELMLYAKPTEIDYKEKIVRMILTDTNGEKEFQINEALVIKGYARYSASYPDDLNKKRLHGERKKHFQEKYPTFDMLENGEYPSFNEIGEYLSKGIDFESIQDENILPDIGDEDIIDYTKKLMCYSKLDSSTTLTENETLITVNEREIDNNDTESSGKTIINNEGSPLLLENNPIMKTIVNYSESNNLITNTNLNTNANIFYNNNNNINEIAGNTMNQNLCYQFLEYNPQNFYNNNSFPSPSLSSSTTYLPNTNYNSNLYQMNYPYELNYLNSASKPLRPPPGFGNFER